MQRDISCGARGPRASPGRGGWGFCAWASPTFRILPPPGPFASLPPGSAPSAPLCLAQDKFSHLPITIHYFTCPCKRLEQRHHGSGISVPPEGRRHGAGTRTVVAKCSDTN